MHVLGIGSKKLEIEAVLIGNSSERRQYDIRCASIGDLVWIEEDDSDRMMITCCHKPLDLGYLSRKDVDRIEELENKGYDVDVGEVIDIFEKNNKLNVRIKIELKKSFE